MPVYLQKSLASQSSGYGVISTAASPVTTLTSATFDTQRRVTFQTTTGADFSGLGITVTGTQDGGGTVTETVWGSTTSTTSWTTLQDYKTVSSLVASSTPGQPVYMFTSAVGGTPWQVVNNGVSPANIGFAVTFATTRTPLAAVLEYSFDMPPGVGGPVNSLSSWGDPFPIVSTSISTAVNTNSAGVCVLPIACWRMSITSTSTAGTTTTSSLKVYINAIQAGLGSGG